MKTESIVRKHVTCPGFKAAGVAAEIKKKNTKDLALLFSEVPATVAGVFTKNRVKAAPVLLDQQRIRAGTCRAVIANSGNANCCTGEQGMADAAAMARETAAALGLAEAEVLVASTGVIGAPMPMARISAAIPKLVRALDPNGFSDFAEAIMTTDTVPKRASKTVRVGGTPFTLTGVAKGAGMIRPDMATMLCFVATDVAAEPAALSRMLSASADRSFNRITIDGDTSTNDTLLLLANGASGLSLADPAVQAAFQDALDDILIDLAKAIVKDGEGVTKFVDIRVTGAATEADARQTAFTVAHSSLVKTALFGEDANWGRVLAAAGRSGVPLDPDRIDIFFDTVQMVKDGRGCGADAETDVTRVLKQAEFSITIDLHMGDAAFSVFTCDFSIDYVKINADYRS